MEPETGEANAASEFVKTTQVNCKTMMDKAVAEVVSDKDTTNTAKYSPRVADLGALVAVEARSTLHAVAKLLLDPHLHTPSGWDWVGRWLCRRSFASWGDSW